MTAGVLVLLLSLGVPVLSSFWGGGKEKKSHVYSTDYGVDVSFPIHHLIEEDSIFKERYENLMKGCEFMLFPEPSLA